MQAKFPRKLSIKISSGVVHNEMNRTMGLMDLVPSIISPSAISRFMEATLIDLKNTPASRDGAIPAWGIVHWLGVVAQRRLVSLRALAEGSIKLGIPAINRESERGGGA